MRKFLGVAVATSLLLAALVPTSASAHHWHLMHKPPMMGGSAGAGASYVGGFISFVALLDLYDLIRRTTCSGDFFTLGGPGFNEAITPGMNILPPQCVQFPRRHRHHRH